MREILLISTLVVSTLAHSHYQECSNKETGFRHVSLADREEYFENMFDVDKPYSEILEDELEWGRKNDIEEEVRSNQKTRTSYFYDHSDRVTDAIKKLPEAYVKMFAYFNDHTLSHTQREKALHRMFKSMSPELRALMQATRAMNIDKLANMEMYPSQRKRREMIEALLKDE